MINGDVAQRRILEHLHQRLARAVTLYAPVLLHRDDDNLLSAVHRDALRAFRLRSPDYLAEASFCILECPSPRTR